ncbi:hypothetical protein BDP27DRAFT_1405091 [Rhodocollybia butyracea]|uniref:DUF6534 domain-containing protein n=1 Tax=Rhodocollybia butyracea TaxID=206335 RepID=A0A9P5PKL5_9AGAR|nr:hypothetical protein BDP27DRAFT_1405091 [Rhodocollybia butyracea]
MANPLAPTYGIWLVSLWLATILYGVGMLQAWLYFHWYSSDHWGVKLTVVCLIVCETLHISCLFGATYDAFVNNFGDAGAIFIITWSEQTQLLAGFLSAFIVQMYFAWCIFLLSKKQKAVTLLIVTLAFAQIGAGLAQTIKSAILGSLLKIDSIKPVVIFQSVAALACDTVITLALYLTLRSKRAGMKRTDTLLQKLMLNAINRGALTTLAAAANIILFLALPGTLYFILGLLISSKLYMNSMLATLNTRQHLMQTMHASNEPWNSNSIHLTRLSTVPNRPLDTPTSTAFHPDDTKSTGVVKPDLVENMI